MAALSAPLNRYLREQAAQDMRRCVATCFVAVSLLQALWLCRFH